MCIVRALRNVLIIYLISAWNLSAFSSLRDGAPLRILSRAAAQLGAPPDASRAVGGPNWTGNRDLVPFSTAGFSL